MNKAKLQRVLSKLSTFDDRVSGTFKSVDDEIAKLSKTLKDGILASSLNYANEEFRKLERKIKPLIESIETLRQDLITREKDLERKVESIISEVNRALSENRDFTRNQADAFFKAIDSINAEKKGMERVFSEKIESLIEEVSFAEAKFSEKTIGVEEKIQNLKTGFQKEINALKGKSSGLSNSEIERYIDALRQEINVRISGLGGGSMNRQILVDGTNVLSKFTDINFISGSGVTLSATSDTTNKRTKIIITGSGANIATERLTPTTSGNDITLDLTALAHTFITIQMVSQDGQILTPTDTWTRSSNTITVTNATTSSVFLVQYTY